MTQDLKTKKNNITTVIIIFHERIAMGDIFLCFIDDQQIMSSSRMDSSRIFPPLLVGKIAVKTLHVVSAGLLEYICVRTLIAPQEKNYVSWQAEVKCCPAALNLLRPSPKHNAMYSLEYSKYIYHPKFQIRQIINILQFGHGFLDPWALIQELLGYHHEQEGPALMVCCFTHAINMNFNKISHSQQEPWRLIFQIYLLVDVKNR
ncbi:hypothetical protein ACJX0J_009828 [Zea mays]